jgi:hypothetical protein
MSEPTLIQTFNEIRLDVAEELGYTRTEGKWSSDQTLEINRRVNDGYRNFLFSAVDNRGKPHRWSFLEPLAQLIVWPTTTGTTVGAPSYSDPSSTITATAAAFYPSMVGKSFTFDTSSTSYTIVSVTSTTVLKVTGDASGEAAADTYTITADGDYRLPDDFGSINGDFLILESGYIRRRARRTNIATILQNRTVYVDWAEIPDIFAIVPEAMTGTTGQRQNVAFYPIPNAVITYTYNYSVLPDALTASAPYPKGVELYSEAIRYASLAEVEKRVGLDRGFKGEYANLLNRAILQDQLVSLPDSLGYNHDPRTARNGRGENRGFYDRTVGALPLYYNGNQV